MLPTKNGSIRLFRLFGIEVFLHWSWFIIAVWQINSGYHFYSSIGWNVAQYVALFGIVLMHEFGHALACRQVGGRANQIVLWPLGGVAYVAPPPRPGATLWAIAAGPLVNAILLPILTVLVTLFHAWSWNSGLSDVQRFVYTLWLINLVLLIFNMLPIYPLDGGQILRSLLWFVVGPARSLMIASVIGFVGVAALIALAVFGSNWWLVVMAAFILMNCWRSLITARQMARLADAPRHHGFACPVCGHPPPTGAFWRCGQCGTALDPFATGGMCPKCAMQFPVTSCPDCGSARPLNDWMARASGPPPVP